MSDLREVDPGLGAPFVVSVCDVPPPKLLAENLPLRIRAIYEIPIGGSIRVRGAGVKLLLDHPALSGREFKVTQTDKWGESWAVERFA